MKENKLVELSMDFAIKIIKLFGYPFENNKTPFGCLFFIIWMSGREPQVR